MAAPRIIVADNDTAFLNLMEDLLSEEGYEVMITAANDQAYDLICRNSPQLVFIDVGFEEPDDGWTVLNLIRLDPQTAQIPVIVSSVNARLLKAKEELLRAKHCDIIEKPFVLDELLDKVRSALGQTGS